MVRQRMTLCLLFLLGFLWHTPMQAQQALQYPQVLQPMQSPQIRPQGRVSLLHPKQDKTAPHHPMGEGDAGVDGKVPGADRLLILSLSFPC